MAGGARILRLRFSLANADEGVYTDGEVTVAQHPSETDERVVARMLAYSLRFEEGLEFGRGVSTADEPALWSRSLDGAVRQWIDVGQPAAKRLVRASRTAERVGLFAFGGGLRRWWATTGPELASLANLEAWCIEAALLDELVARLERSNRWAVTLSGGELFVEAGGATFQSRLEPLAPGPPA